MKKKKLTAADLALYLGQKCVIFLNGTATHEVEIRGPFLTVYSPDCHDALPIIRPMSDMTASECEQARVFDDYTHDVKGKANLTKYLLSIGIDLFGWIDAGLAIDKTKMETP